LGDPHPSDVPARGIIIVPPPPEEVGHTPNVKIYTVAVVG